MRAANLYQNIFFDFFLNDNFHDRKKTIITLVTTPGTEFRTGKSNDLVILKNFEKHDIFLDFMFAFKSEHYFTGSEGINNCFELSRIWIKIKFVFSPLIEICLKFGSMSLLVSTLYTSRTTSTDKTGNINTGNDIFRLRSTIENTSLIKYVIIDWNIIFAFDRF